MLPIIAEILLILLQKEMDFTPNGAKSSHELASPVQKETDYPRKKDKKTAGPVHTRNDVSL